MIGDTAREFGVDWPHFIAQVVSFCIVAFLLHRFAYKPVVDLLEERRRRIAEGLANADKIKVELARAETQRQEVLTQANAQANKLIEEARAAAARVQEQETQKAIAAAEQIISKAREAASQDHARMLSEYAAAVRDHPNGHFDACGSVYRYRPKTGPTLKRNRFTPPLYAPITRM